MKIKSVLLISLAVVALGVAGCAWFGAEPNPPTKFDEALFNIKTNQVITATVTTNSTGQSVTNLATKETYTETPKMEVTSTFGTILNYVIPGSKGIATLGATLVLGLLGHLRSYKRGQTNNAMGQEVETMLEFLNALPNGSSYYNAIVSFLQSHQAEAGVTQEVLALLRDKISNPDAKIAAQEIIDAINGLPQGTGTTPIPPVALIDK